MTERYILSHNGEEDGLLDKNTKKEYYGFDLAKLVNKQNDELIVLRRAEMRLTKENKWLKRELVSDLNE